MARKIVKVNLHSQMLKFGRKPDPAAPKNVLDLVMSQAERQKAESCQNKTVGFDLTFSEDRALFAVQKLLDATGYRGNGAVYLVPQEVYHIASVPTLQVKQADYLRAYGLEPLRSGRGKLEFSSGGRKAAIGALERLAERSFLIIYEKRDANGAVERVERVAPLLQLPAPDPGMLHIVPNPVIVDQIHGYRGRDDSGYFMWIPENLHAQVGGRDVAAIRFMEFLLYHTTRMWRKRRPEIRFQMETVAYWLRLDHLLASRKRRELRERLNGYYELAVHLGYLKSYASDQTGVRSKKVDVFTPNREFIHALIAERDS